MTRVLLDARVTTGGIGRYARELPGALRAARPDLTLDVIVRGNGPVSDRLRAPFTPWGRAAVARDARRLNVDLVHALHLETPSSIPRTVVTIHDVIPLEHPASMPNPLRRALFGRILRASLSRATTVIVPSQATADALLARGASSRKVVVVPNGVGETFRPLSETERVRARASFAGGRPYVAAIAHAKKHKNFAGLVAASLHVVSGTDVRVVCAGPRLAEGEGVVHYVGELTDADLRLFYGGAHAFVLPSLVEGFGLPALEAAATGVPVVCGPGAGVLPYIRTAAIEVDVSDPRDIATGILRVLDDDSLRSELAAEGVKVARRLTWGATAAGTLAVYDDVLRRA